MYVTYVVLLHWPGAPLVRGEQMSWPKWKSPRMMDKQFSNTNKIVHQSVVVGGCGGIATALRDRKCYAIPIQPNRSLPVRPAPRHTHRRSTNNDLNHQNSSSSSATAPSLLPSTVYVPTCLALRRSLLSSNYETSVVVVDDDNNDSITTFDEKTEKAEIIEDIVEEEMRKSSNGRNVVTTSDERIIVETCSSPERIDLSFDTGSDEASLFTTSRVDSSTSAAGCWYGEEIKKAREKRKRRRKEKRTSSENNERGEGEGETRDRSIGIEKSKTVPPLRLKKIQSLEETGLVSSFVSSWHEPRISEATNNKRIEEMEINKMPWSNNDIPDDLGNYDRSSEYRIVTGLTPPYEEERCTDLRNLEESSNVDSLEEAKLAYKKSKLRVKLKELKRKTLELGKEIIPMTVPTSSTGPRGVRERRIRRTINRYQEQIGNLEKMLNEMPRSAASVIEDKNVRVDWQMYEISGKENASRDYEGLASSPPRISSYSNSSSLSSSPSLEPPKLSPSSPTNYELIRSPSELRNSPPILPRVYVTIADYTDDSWDEENDSRGRPLQDERAKRKKTSDPRRESSLRSSICSPLVATITNPVNETDRPNEKLDVSESMNVSQNFEISSDLAKNDLDNSSCNSLDILEIYDSKDLVDNTKEVKPLIKESPSSPEAQLGVTKLDLYEIKSDPPTIIDEIDEPVDRVHVESTNDPLLLSVACDTKQESNDNEQLGKEIVIVGEDIAENGDEENGNVIGEQFPTFGNWIARLSNKRGNELPESTSAKVSTGGDTAVEEYSSAFQIFSSDQPIEATSPEVTENEIRVVAEENAAPRQWKNKERWQEQPTNQHQHQQQQQHQHQHQHQQQPLVQSFNRPTAVPLPPPQVAAQALGQEFCSPIAMARLYTSNYPIDPYAMAYGYNPAVAAAAATASIWNSAAILQYPLIRSNSAILNAQQPRISSGNIQFPSTGTVPAQRSSYRFSSLRNQNEISRRTVNHESTINYGHRDTTMKLSAQEMSTRFDHPKRTGSDYQSHVVDSVADQARSGYNSTSGKSVNYRNTQQQQRQHQHHHQQSLQSQQQQFARSSYADSTMITRLPVPAVSWRTDHLLGPMTNNDYNYSPANNNIWSANSGNILDSLVKTTASSFATPGNLISMTSSRSRLAKEAMLSTMRNCVTPNLGKVNYSPNAINNLECSNCGLAGSMFKCLGCEVAFYCDENCQARHWNRHVISCPKKMPKLKKLVH